MKAVGWILASVKKRRGSTFLLSTRLRVAFGTWPSSGTLHLQGLPVGVERTRVAIPRNSASTALYGAFLAFQTVTRENYIDAMPFEGYRAGETFSKCGDNGTCVVDRENYPLLKYRNGLAWLIFSL